MVVLNLTIIIYVDRHHRNTRSHYSEPKEAHSNAKAL
jgi:hypothetical protein